MNISQTESLIKQGESERLELKKSTANLKDIFQTICGFLNGDGGTTKRPYFYNGRAYVRVQSDTLPMPAEHYQQLTLNNSQFNSPWEDQLLFDVTLDDLDTDEILGTIQEGVLNGRIPQGHETNDPVKALNHLGLMKNKQITQAALILFGKQPEKIFPQCILRLARFRGTDKTEFIDNKQIQGNIFKLIRAALNFANAHLPIASTFPKDSITKKDQPLFPITTLREAITNAICHRDYSYSGGSASFAIYDDRLEIWNYGLLPPGLSIENLGELNQSIPRNRKIANVLYYHKLVELWGRGIKLIIDGCVNAGHPLPVYCQNSGGILLTMPSTLTSVKSKKQTTDKKLTENHEEVLRLIENNKLISSNELRTQLSFSPSERWVRYALNKLKKVGYIDAKGNTTSRKWFMKEK